MKNILGGGVYKQSPKKKILIGIFLISILFIVIIAKNTSQVFIKKESSQESFFAIYINDEKTTYLPKKEDGYSFDEEKSYCNNGVKIQWSYLLWTANIDYTDYELQNKERTYCNLYFKAMEKYTFDYTGNEQEFVVPKDGYYQVELWGAANGSGGYGAYTSGIVHFPKQEQIYFYIGQKGYGCDPYTLCTGESFNGGGPSGFFTTSDTNYRNTGGSGATDVRLENGAWNDFQSLKSRLMVASGGAVLVSAGGIVGYSSDEMVGGGAVNGSGASQTSGGSTCANAGFGTFGIGGKGYTSYPNEPRSNDSYGGSGGYYGGSGGCGGAPTGSGNNRGYGSSGSSFISGHNGCDAIKEESTSDNIIHTGEPNHYSGYIFTETKMIDGKGYAWTDTKQELEAMPNPQGGYYDVGLGHIGNGYARITYLGK